MDPQAWYNYVTGLWTMLMREHGLERYFAWKIANLLSWAYYYRIPARVVSGYRDDTKQKALQARWDAGNRVGLVTRPVSNSKHSYTENGQPAAKAVDIAAADENQLKIMGEWATKYLDLEWGGNYRSKDPVHFEEI